jgi:hypothetical protein
LRKPASATAVGPTKRFGVRIETAADTVAAAL